jgi:hypothetical protein
MDVPSTADRRILFIQDYNLYSAISIWLLKYTDVNGCMYVCFKIVYFVGHLLVRNLILTTQYTPPDT